MSTEESDASDEGVLEELAPELLFTLGLDPDDLVFVKSESHDSDWPLTQSFCIG